MPRSGYPKRGAAEFSREARKRLAWFDYHDAHGRNVALTCRHSGISREAFYRWMRRGSLKWKFSSKISAKGGLNADD